MQNIEEIGVIDTELDATIHSQETDDTIECIILNITRDYTDVMAVASDPRVCERKAIDLGIFVPTEKLPIKCVGRIIWHLEGDELTGSRNERCLVRIFISDISQVDQERLDRLINQKKALLSSSRF